MIKSMQHHNIQCSVTSHKQPSPPSRGFFINMVGFTDKEQVMINSIEYIIKTVFTDNSFFNMRYDYYLHLPTKLAIEFM